MAIVFDIQRFCTHDGPGIRTVVFLKGCPLDCWWCHNPESKRARPELFYTPKFCIGCGRCVAVCEPEGHRIVEGAHVFDRSGCVLCLRCAAECHAGALEAVGHEMTVEQVLAEVEKDRVFYEESGGGMTLSGGEPMMQFEFTRDLLAGAKAAGLHTAIETSGFGLAEQYLEVTPLVDLFLWDLKDTDPERHETNTGVGLDVILANLKRVDEAGGKTLLRCLLIAGVNLNEEHLDGIASIYRELKHCEGAELLRYHALGGSKDTKLGVESQSDSSFSPTPEQMDWARGYLRDRGSGVED